MTRALAASGMNPGLNGVILREAYTMAVSAFGLLILAAAVLFYIPLVTKMGVPRLIIGLFFILLCLLAMILGLSLPSQLSNTLVRLGMNGVLVLAMLPGIQCDISLNLGCPSALSAASSAACCASSSACPASRAVLRDCGRPCGLRRRRAGSTACCSTASRGSEMSVTTYVGLLRRFSLMCIAWLVLPFKSPIMKWPAGQRPAQPPLVCRPPTATCSTISSPLRFSA